MHVLSCKLHEADKKAQCVKPLFLKGVFLNCKIKALIEMSTYYIVLI